MKFFDSVINSTVPDGIRPLFKTPITTLLNANILKQMDCTFEVFFSTASHMFGIKASFTYKSNSSAEIMYNGNTDNINDNCLFWAIIDGYFYVFAKNVFGANAEIYLNVTGSRGANSLQLLNGKYMDLTNVELHAGVNTNIYGKGNIGNRYYYSGEIRDNVVSAHSIPNYSASSKSYFHIYARRSNGYVAIFEGSVINGTLYKNNLTTIESITVGLNNGKIEVTYPELYGFLEIEIVTNM